MRPVHAEGPAVETSLHQWGRPATDDHGKAITGKVACTKWTPLEAAYDHGRLGEKDSADANNRLNAGQTYERLWDASLCSGRDSTQGMNFSRGTSGSGSNASQATALADLERIDRALSQRDRIIIRMVCGQGFFPSEAVATVSPDYAKATAARFRESLDALIEAIAAAKIQGRVNA